ncbi:MAG: glycoside hydrolase family 32 protein [Clostridia bacterium]|nr:glycoside hydrolase family 32 protein [Clostridia bacterium]
MKYTTSLADQYIALNSGAVNPRYLPYYHLCAPVGWINDPNGFCFFKGRYHLFCQFHPYDSVWGPMHWAHWSSDNLLHWTMLPVALAPDTPADSYGCFSGTIISKNGLMYLAYTGAVLTGGDMRQQQCMALSWDGIHFKKHPANPIITPDMLPPNHSSIDFRDPRLIKTPDGYSMLVASRKGNDGAVVSFSSKDLENWTFENTLFEQPCSMIECPDLYELDGCKVLCFCIEKISPDGLRFPNRFPVVYVVMDDMNARSFPEAIDHGLDFYAPQSLLCPDGQRVMIGWMRTWGIEEPTHYLGHGWAGTLTLPRELHMKNGRLLQKPLCELKKLRAVHRQFDAMPVHNSRVRLVESGADAAELTVALSSEDGSPVQVRLMESEDEYFSVIYAAHDRTLTVDRSRCGYQMRENNLDEAKPWTTASVPGENGCIQLHIFIDRCSVEIFVDDGALVMSSLCFPKSNNYGISICCEGRAFIRHAELWHLSATNTQ